jgi:hypothetical protein
MKNEMKFAIGSAIVLLIGGYLTRDKWMPLLAKPNEEEPKKEEGAPAVEDKHIVVAKHEAEPAKVSPPTESGMYVYAKYKNTEIKLADKGTTAENIIVLGKAVRKTEGANEKLGKFIKYITIFATPFVLFTDSYSGRNVLVVKSAVTVK